MNISKFQLEELRKCENKKDLCDFFEKHNITNNAEKSAFLKAATGEIEAYYAGGDEDLSIDDKYNDNEYLFLEGTWKAFS